MEAKGLLLTSVAMLLGIGLLAGPMPGESPRYFLDLPNAEGESQETEEDIPEIIQFYGQEYEGDGIFFCLDHSGSMSWQTSGGVRKLDVLKEEFAKALQGMTENVEFAVVFFDASVIPFRETPMEADASNKSAVSQWVQSMGVGHGTCIGGGAQKCLEIANKSQKSKKTMILLGDGDPTWCGASRTTQSHEQAKMMIRQANTQKIPINTIFIGSPDQNEGREFMRQVAQEYGGTFTEGS